MTQQTGSMQSDAYVKAYAALDPKTGAPIKQPSADQSASSSSHSPQNTSSTSKKSHKTAIVVALCIVIVIALLCISCTAATAGVTRSLQGAFGTEGPAKASVPSIAVIDIASTIGYDGSASSPDGLRWRLKAASDDSNVKGVILRVNSGGGSATAGEEMAALVAAFEKPIVVSSQAMNASAAYEISSQADYIYCAKTTSIGAIGVLLQVTDLSGLYDKLGINIESIVSEPSKDAGQGNRPLTKKEREWYQNMVNEIDADFVQTVANGRNMTVAEVKALANGLPYTGTKAVEVKLADKVGYYKDALAYISQLAGSDTELPTLSYESSNFDLSSLLSLFASSKTNALISQNALIQ